MDQGGVYLLPKGDLVDVMRQLEAKGAEGISLRSRSEVHKRPRPSKVELWETPPAGSEAEAAGCAFVRVSGAGFPLYLDDITPDTPFLQVM